MKLQDQEKVLVEVTQRVLQSQDKTQLESILLDTLFEEKQRLSQSKKSDTAKTDQAFYRKIQKKLLHSGPEQQRKLLEEIIYRFAKEVLGHFSQAMYNVATQAIPIALNLLLNTVSPLRLLKEFPHGFFQVDRQVELLGEIKPVQQLAKKGTLILAPTHVSNLDSPLIGYALYRIGLPPFLYGAGLNLFSNKLMGFFMDHLGAYKVDRRKKANLYKEVLKCYAGYSMELGYHNLFFVGGTRSRSGQVEQHLKLGLLGMGLNAYIHNLITKKKHADIFIVPCTLNYQLVLEAKTLIEDHLQAVGKSRFIIEDDESYQIQKIFRWLRQLFALESRIQVVLGTPLDPFGNTVDLEGRSHDHRGRVIDRSRYVMRDGVPDFEAQRDQEYTHELGRSIAEDFARNTVIGSVPLVSWVVFHWLQELHPEMDLYRLLRSGGNSTSLKLPELYTRLQGLWKKLRKLEAQGRLRLDQTLQREDPVFWLAEALAHLQHADVQPVLERHGERIFPKNLEILLYYQNRMVHLEGLL